MKKMTPAKHLHFLQVDENTYIGWNRFYPSIFILNDAVLELFELIKKGESLDSYEDVGLYLEEFKKYKFLFDGDTDPSRENFIKIVKEQLEKPDLTAKEFYKQGKAYKELKLVIDECNLACPYCVNNYGKKPVGIKKRDEEKLKIIYSCIDQFFTRLAETGEKEAKLFFNGGEILVEWELIKEIIERVEKKYTDIKIKYDINTNLSLLTDEIARFFKEREFTVHISIDGYKEAHNRTRIYHSGKGSFDDVIRNVELYRKYNKDGLKSFQGTIGFPDEFDPGEVYKMTEHGFAAARLAPNLLDEEEEDARKKARLMGKFLELNNEHSFKVLELIFTRLKDKVNQEQYKFNFNCRGLCALPDMGIEVNLSSLSLSHLCGFIPRAALPIEELDYDIYNPKLWETSYRYIKERMESLLENCMECELVGICAGGCIMFGLNKDNRINKAACAYQKEMWKIYVQKAYDDSKKRK
jgi:radical SAM protein with 4Fe4S-binding SPASM domain